MVSMHAVVVALILVTLVPADRAFAQDRRVSSDRLAMVTAMPTAGPVRAAIEHIDFDALGQDGADRSVRATSSATQAASKDSLLLRVGLASVGGLIGSVGGARLGAKIEGPCNCDSPGFKGALIGAPIGAIVGTIAGWKFAGLLSR